MEFVGISLIEYVGDSSARLYATTNDSNFWYIAAAAYVGVFQTLIYILRTHNVLYTNVMWDGVSALIESALAYLLLGDRLDSPIQYFGALLIILGLFLINYTS